MELLKITRPAIDLIVEVMLICAGVIIAASFIFIVGVK
jgi:hypothetical protein